MTYGLLYMLLSLSMWARLRLDDLRLLTDTFNLYIMVPIARFFCLLLLSRCMMWLQKKKGETWKPVSQHTLYYTSAAVGWGELTRILFLFRFYFRMYFWGWRIVAITTTCYSCQSMGGNVMKKCRQTKKKRAIFFRRFNPLFMDNFPTE